MPQDTQQDIAYCFQRAEEARRLGENETNPIRRQEYTDMEARWVRLAMSYRLAAQLNTFNHDIHR